MENNAQIDKRINLTLTKLILLSDIDNRISVLQFHPRVIEIEIDEKHTHYLVIEDADDIIKAVQNLLKN